MSLTLEHVACRYGGTRIFDDFNLVLAERDQALLLGPSGSGKTTLIYLICGLLSPERGKIVIGDTDMAALAQAKRDALRRARIGVVFQTLRLVSALNVRANLLLAQRLSGHAPEPKAANDLLDRLGIAHRALAKPATLSQGEAQRAAIARALVTRPALLIADEPTSALDDENALRVGQLLVETAKAQGSTLLVATHDARLRALIPNAIELKRAAVAA
ncbi:MAG: ATP-binding cassette domain-containing protein [Terricaulis sp.]